MSSFLSKFPITNIIFSTNYRHYNQIIMNIIPRTISTHQNLFSITHIIICTSQTNMEAFSQPYPTVLLLSSWILYFPLAFLSLYKLPPLSFPSNSAPPDSFPFMFCFFLIQYISDLNHQLNSNPQILSPYFYLANTVQIPKISWFARTTNI